MEGGLTGNQFIYLYLFIEHLIEEAALRDPYPISPLMSLLMRSPLYCISFPFTSPPLYLSYLLLLPRVQSTSLHSHTHTSPPFLPFYHGYYSPLSLTPSYLPCTSYNLPFHSLSLATCLSTIIPPTPSHFIVLISSPTPFAVKFRTVISQKTRFAFTHPMQVSGALRTDVLSWIWRGFGHAFGGFSVMLFWFVFLYFFHIFTAQVCSQSPPLITCLSYPFPPPLVLH